MFRDLSDPLKPIGDQQKASRISNLLKFTQRWYLIDVPVVGARRAWFLCVCARFPGTAVDLATAHYSEHRELTAARRHWGQVGRPGWYGCGQCSVVDIFRF